MKIPMPSFGKKKEVEQPMKAPIDEMGLVEAPRHEGLKFDDSRKINLDEDLPPIPESEENEWDTDDEGVMIRKPRGRPKKEEATAEEQGDQDPLVQYVAEANVSSLELLKLQLARDQLTVLMELSEKLVKLQEEMRNLRLDLRNKR
jgi:hypothetical protein